MDTGNPVSKSPMIIAIDGPAGAGKSTVTRRVAQRLGILYLDTGAMYRAATVGLLASGVDRDDVAAIGAWVAERQIDFDAEGRVRLDGTVVPEEQLRSPATTAEIWRVADPPACRAHLVALQQAIVAGRDAALEGRDATTVICPDADLKIYLDASAAERARRRLQDWQGADAPVFEEVVAAIEERDRRDSQRAVGALTQADDAVVVDTDGQAVEEVIARIIGLAVQRRPMLLEQRLTDQVRVGRNRQPGYVRVAEGSINDPPLPWQLGLTNPSRDRLPETCTRLARNHGGRQAGVIVQGRAVLVLAGRGEQPTMPVALPMLPQTWYVIEPGAWHAVIQQPGSVGAWAEASGLSVTTADLDAEQLAAMRAYFSVYLG